MAKIGLFYGSDTDNTYDVAEMIKESLGEDNIELVNISECSPDDFAPYDKIIIGLSTWYDGELQSDWDDFYEDFKTIDFTGKTVAIFGLGDQVGYAEWFCDGIGILGEIVSENGGQVIGLWSPEGYEYESSKAEIDLDGEKYLMGLALDQDNEEEKTEERLQSWLEQIKQEFEEE